MDFQRLLAKMVELDRPAMEACGDPIGMPPAPSTPPPTPPSMSVNLNAQGMDNIESLLKLMTKVNPDMINQPGPITTSPMPAPIPAITSIKPELPPLKMLPDFDKEEPAEIPFGGPSGINAPDNGPMDIDGVDLGKDMDGDNDNKPGGEMDSDYNDDGKLDRHEKDHASEKPLLKTLDQDKDGDHDMDDHDMEKDSDDGEEDDEKKKEAWANEPDEQVRSVDYMNNQLAGGMNKPKDTFPKVADGDNPMQRVKEGGDLRAQIRAELLQRLAEAKGAK
jgi:hypothetical protein